MGTFLASLDISIVNVALPAIQESLNSDLSGLQWVVNAYAICLSAFMLSASAFSDRYGHKKVWLMGVAFFTLGSYLCAVAPSMPMLLLGRVVQGVAAAVLIPGAMSMIAYAYPEPKERVGAIGVWSALSALALILGPFLGGWLVHYTGWHGIFSINLPIGFVALGLGLWSMPERRDREAAALDPAGQLLSVVGLGLLSYGLIQAGVLGFTAPLPVALLLAFGLVLALFIWLELKVAKPLVNLRLFQAPFFASVNFASFILGFAGYSSLFFFSVFLQQVQGQAPQQAGMQMMPQFVLMGLVSLGFGWLNRWVSTHVLMNLGYGLIGLAMVLMTSWGSDTPYLLIGGLFALLGVGMGLAVPATSMVVMSAVAPSQFAMASAMVNALRQTGMSVGIALLASVMSVQASHVMQERLAPLGLTDLMRVVEEAIRYHRFVGEPVAWIRQAYVAGMESGFAVVMGAAGVACLFVMLLLCRVKRPMA
ncbi:MAG: MFS transporter [Neisseriaceae bacterium]|nr:MFS transporter [Neisseriaceae bacterium]